MRGARSCHGRHRRQCGRKAAGKREMPLSPIAVEVVHRIVAPFEIERSIETRVPGSASKCTRHSIWANSSQGAPAGTT